MEGWEIIGFDHVAFAVYDIELWTRRYVRRGADVIYDNPDASPHGKSSMHIRGILWGGLRIALLLPINREEESQVAGTLRRHGDHSFQHIAIRVKNLANFKNAMELLGTNFVGEIGERPDAFGPVRQIFGRTFDKTIPPEEGEWWEFVERPESETPADKTPNSSRQDFDDKAAEKLFQDIEYIIKSGSWLAFIEDE